MAGAISRLKTLNIYKELLENPKAQVASKTQENVMEICDINMDTVYTSMLATEQKWDKICRNLSSQTCHSNKSNFRSVIMWRSGILQKQQYVLNN